MRVLVTGGAGYIGSHTSLALLQAGHDVVVFDNLASGSRRAVDRISELAGRSIRLVEGDVRDRAALEKLLSGGFDAAIHFAALKSVPESCRDPLRYFENNIGGTIALLGALVSCEVRKLVFSSSATVYGDPDAVPVKESAPLKPNNPYGRSKLIAEQLIGDLCASHAGFSAFLLRYFNPVGAHPSGLLGEDPHGVPANLVPYVAQVAIGRLEKVRIYGNDYATRDGTGMRDYIHVMDVASAHVKALEALDSGRGCQALNLGTGKAASVLDVLQEFQCVSGREIPYEFAPRRTGDVASCWADPGLAASVLDWRAEHDLRRMCADAWRWQSRNPNGYQ